MHSLIVSEFFLTLRYAIVCNYYQFLVKSRVIITMAVVIIVINIIISLETNVVNNDNKSEWSPIRSVIIRVI